MLDNLSDGRVDLAGMGYASCGFGLPVARRVSLMNEGIEVLQRCFPVSVSVYGKRYQFEDCKIRPGYATRWSAADSRYV